ncbi:hypothetical protein EMIT053CA3_30152 [Pseudomonas donghuensis]
MEHDQLFARQQQLHRYPKFEQLFKPQEPLKRRDYKGFTGWHGHCNSSLRD